MVSSTVSILLRLLLLASLVLSLTRSGALRQYLPSAHVPSAVRSPKTWHKATHAGGLLLSPWLRVTAAIQGKKNHTARDELARVWGRAASDTAPGTFTDHHTNDDEFAKGTAG